MLLITLFSTIPSSTASAGSTILQFKCENVQSYEQALKSNGKVFQMLINVAVKSNERWSGFNDIAL